MGIWGNRYLGKIYIWGNWTPREMSTGANRHQGKWTFGEKGYPKCLVSIFPKCLLMGIGANGHLGQMDIWGKRGTPSALCPFPPNVCKWTLGQMGTWGKCIFGGKRHPKCPEEVPQVSYAHVPQMFTSEQWGKWALGVNAHLGEGGTPCPKRLPQVPYGHFPQMYVNKHWGKWAPGVNAHLGERGTPSALCPFTPNVYKWALGQMDIWGKGHPKCPVPISSKFFKWAVEKMGLGDPSAHLPQCPFCPSAHLGDMGTGHLDYPFTQ